MAPPPHVGAVDTHAPKYPTITVELDRDDKKVHAVMAKVLGAMIMAGIPPKERLAFVDDIKYSSGRAEAVAVAGNWVNVVGV